MIVYVYVCVFLMYAYLRTYVRTTVFGNTYDFRKEVEEKCAR